MKALKKMKIRIIDDLDGIAVQFFKNVEPPWLRLFSVRQSYGYFLKNREVSRRVCVIVRRGIEIDA